jgi:hypothetical protein
MNSVMPTTSTPKGVAHSWLLCSTLRRASSFSASSARLISARASLSYSCRSLKSSASSSASRPRAPGVGGVGGRRGWAGEQAGGVYVLVFMFACVQVTGDMHVRDAGAGIAVGTHLWP